MKPNSIDWPGRIIFLSGVVLVIASTALGLYLAQPHWGDNVPLDWHLPGYDEQLTAVRAQVEFLWNVYALMWLTFGFGVTLTLVGLRMMIHPPIDLESTSPIKPRLDLSED